MKLRTICLLAFLTASYLIFSSRSGGPATIQSIQATGSPLDNTSCANSGCHFGGAFRTNITAVLLKGGDTVSQYIPGEEYVFQININSINNPAAYGFQTVALMGEDNESGGLFQSGPDQTNFVTINNRLYVEHAAPRNSNVIEVGWLAPEAGSGDVSFYAAGNAVNLDGATSGDSPSIMPQPLVVSEGIASGIFKVDRLSVNLSLYPNPGSDWLNIEIVGADIGSYQIQLIDIAGKVVWSQQLNIIEQQFVKKINLSGFQLGLYFLKLTDGNAVATSSFFKK